MRDLKPIFHLSAVFCAGMVLFASCGEDDVNFAPADFRLCVGVWTVNGQQWVEVLDAKADSIVDSLAPVSYPPYAWGSPRGDFLSASGRIYDLRTGLMVTEIKGYYPLFLPEAELYLLCYPDTVMYFQTPEFNLVDKIAVHGGLRPAVLVPNSATIAAVRLQISAMGDNRKEIVVFDYEEKSIIDSFFVPTPDGSGDSLSWLDIEPSPDGSRLFGLSLNWSEVVCIDLATHGVVFRTRATWRQMRTCRINPDDENELWVSVPGALSPFGGPITAGWIMILDSRTGAVLDTIPTLGLDTDSTVRWEVDDIQFVPGQHKAYVNCRPFHGVARPLLVIDTKNREVTKMIFGEQTGMSPFSISLVPKY